MVKEVELNVEDKVKQHLSDGRDYCEKHNVYDLLTNLMTEVVRQKPADIIEFCKNKLSAPAAVRVCIVGPPGSSVEAIATQVSEQLSATSIHLDQVVPSNNGEWVEDSKVNEAMLAKLNAESGSWVCCNYPRTRNQALAMMNAKCLPNKIIVCNVSDAQLEAAFEAQGACAQRDMQQYTRHLQETICCLDHLTKQVDASQDEHTVMEAVQRAINYNATSAAPHVPLKICVVGDENENRNGRAADLAKLYGAVHVKHNGNLDELKAALNEPQCKSKGWVVEGCPCDATSAEFMHSAGLAPHRMVEVSNMDPVNSAEVADAWPLCHRRIAEQGEQGTQAVVNFVNEKL